MHHAHRPDCLPGRLWRTVAGAAGALVLAACTSLSPTLQPPLAATATVLTPLRHAGVADERAAFRQLFCQLVRRDGWLADDHCGAWLQRLADEPSAPPAPVTALLAPLPRQWDAAVAGGAFVDCVDPIAPLLGEALAALRAAGMVVEKVPVFGREPTERNAEIIRAYVEDHARRRPGQKLLLLAYSKGVTDAVRALQLHPGLAARIRALVSVAGMVNGAALADSLPTALRVLAARAPLGDCEPGNRDFFTDLSRTTQLAALARAPLPRSVRMYSIVALPDPERVSLAMRPHWEKLSRIHPRNDGELFDHDAILPGSTLLAYANADHLTIAVPLERHLPALAALLAYRAYPRAALIEAAVRMAVAAPDRKPETKGDAR